MVAAVSLPVNCYICQYIGDYVTHEEAQRREETYEQMKLKHTYVLHVSYCSVCVCVHAYA